MIRLHKTQTRQASSAPSKLAACPALSRALATAALTAVATIVAGCGSTGGSGLDRPTPVPPGLTAAKARIFRKMDNQRRANVNRQLPPLPKEPPQHRQHAGIEPAAGAPAADFYDPSNLWAGPERGRWLIVYAGGVESGAFQLAHTKRQFQTASVAAVSLYTEPLANQGSGGNLRFIRTTEAPGHPRGTLVAVRWSGLTLRLRDQRTGATYRFNLRSERFDES